jgi:chromosome partitioning protein
MRTIAVIARKGGSGKTTVAVHLAIAAYLRARQVLVADTDRQQSASTVLRSRGRYGPNFTKSSGAHLRNLQRVAVQRKMDVMLIDTAAGADEDLAPALDLADLTLLVIRPTFLDFAAAVETAAMLRGMARPGVIVLNQAPVARAGVEPPLVRKAREAVRLMRLPVAPTILRSRAVYQQALATGRSAEELGPSPAAEEVAELWSFVERLTFGASAPVRARA